MEEIRCSTPCKVEASIEELRTLLFQNGKTTAEENGRIQELAWALPRKEVAPLVAEAAEYVKAINATEPDIIARHVEEKKRYSEAVEGIRATTDDWGLLRAARGLKKAIVAMDALPLRPGYYATARYNVLANVVEKYPKEVKEKAAPSTKVGQKKTAKVSKDNISFPDLMKKFGGRCYYCAARVHDGYPLNVPSKATMDHVYPLRERRKGKPAVVVLACKECNDAKGCFAPAEWKVIKSPNAPFPGERYLTWKEIVI